MIGKKSFLGVALLALVGCGGEIGPTLLPTASAPTPVPNNLPPPVVPQPGPNPPVIGATHTNPDPAEGPAPLTVNFNLCRSSDPDGDPLSFLYNFGDGKSREVGRCRHEHAYQNPGSYLAQVCVSDGRNSSCRSFVVTAF